MNILDTLRQARSRLPRFSLSDLADKPVGVVLLTPDADGQLTVSGASGGAASLPTGGATEATLQLLRPAGTGPLLSQTSGTITAASQALTGIPAGANFAQLQFHGAGVSARYDATDASNSPSEETYAAGGTLRLITAADIAGFRYIGTAVGAFSITYRSY